MVALAEFDFQFLRCLFMHFIVIIELVEVIDELLVVLNCQVRFQFLHIFYFVFVAYQLLLHFTDYFITALIPLLDIRIPPMKLFCLLAHIFEKRILQVEITAGPFHIAYDLQIFGNGPQESRISRIFLSYLRQYLCVYV